MAAHPRTILVVEEALLIRLMVVDVLTDTGFDAIDVENTQDALAALEGRAVHLLFTDTDMPGPMSGLQLAHHVRATWPHIGLLVTSWGDQPSRLPNGGVFLAKPYSVTHLVAHARALTAE